MTEEEWLQSANLDLLFGCLELFHNDRKWLLLVAACCRHLASRDGYADAATRAARIERDAERAGAQTLGGDSSLGDARDYAWQTCDGCCQRVAYDFIRSSPLLLPADAERAWREVFEREQRRQVSFARDIFGNPFRPVALDPSWLTSTVAALAEGIYADRAFDQTPILADALQDAGCDSADILTHCRDPHATHVRGCWVIDLLTNRN